MVELRMPSITGTEREQLAKMRSYLYQLIPQLEWALNHIETPTTEKPKTSSIPLISSNDVAVASISNEGFDPNNLSNGVHVIKDNAITQGDTVIMENGVLIQKVGDTDNKVKFQIALPTDRSPMYRLYWDSEWGEWRSINNN